MGDGERTDLAELAATVDRLARALAEVEAENTRLRARVETLERGPEQTTRRVPPADPSTSGDGRIDRRRLLRDGLVAGAAATAAVVATAPPTAAANGDPMIVGSSGNTATQETGLIISGTPAGVGFSVIDNSYQGVLPEAALFAHAKDQAFDIAVAAVTDSIQGTAALLRGGNTGLRVENAFTGVSSSATEAAFSGSGGYGISVSASVTGVRISSGRAHIAFGAGGRGAPPADTLHYDRGDVVATQAGELWACVAEGTPGTWRKIVSPQAAGAFHVLPAPVRIYDSRPGTLPSQGPKTALGSGVSRSLDLKHNGTTVPAGATAALVTVLLVGAATASGNLTIWANGIPKPASNTMVWGGNATRFTTTATTALDANAFCQVAASHPTHLVLDVVGYYR